LASKITAPYPSRRNSAAHARLASADQGDVLSVFFTRLEHIDAVIEHVVDGVPLQTSNLNRLLSFRI